jgi:hypothetical protein
MFLNGGKLPWDTDPLPSFECDEKDPLIYKKTLDYEKQLRKWDKAYCDRKLQVSLIELTKNLPSCFYDYLYYCEEQLAFD